MWIASVHCSDTWYFGAKMDIMSSSVSQCPSSYEKPPITHLEWKKKSWRIIMHLKKKTKRPKGRAVGMWNNPRSKSNRRYTLLKCNVHGCQRFLIEISMSIKIVCMPKAYRWVYYKNDRNSVPSAEALATSLNVYIAELIISLRRRYISRLYI